MQRTNAKQFAAFAALWAISSASNAMPERIPSVGFVTASIIIEERNPVAEVIVGLRDFESVAADFSAQIDFVTTDGSAQAGRDYLFTNGSLTLTKSSPRAIIEVSVLPDNVSEGLENFQIRLNSLRATENGQPVQVRLLLATANVTIQEAGARASLTPNQLSLGTALDTICPDLRQRGNLTVEQQELKQTCDTLEAQSIGLGKIDVKSVTDESVAVTAPILQNIVPEEISAQGETGGGISQRISNSITTRLAEVRTGISGASMSGLTLQIDGSEIAASQLLSPLNLVESTKKMPHWGAFVSGKIGFGEKKDSLNETGLDFSSQGLTAGVDYRVSSASVVGFAVNYDRITTEYARNKGELDSNSIGGIVYGTIYGDDRWYLDGAIGYGAIDYEMKRHISAPIGDNGEEISQLAGSEADSSQFSGVLGGGYSWHRNAWQFDGTARLEYSKISIDAWTEQALKNGPGDGLLLHIGEQEITSLTSNIGVQAAYAISTGFGVVVPQLTLEYAHEFSDEQRHISGRFIHDPTSTGFTVQTEEPDRDFLNVGLGITSVFAHQTWAYLYYETTLGFRDLQSHDITFGLRREF